MATSVERFPVVGFIPRLKPMGFRLDTAVTEIATETTLEGETFVGDAIALRGRPQDYVVPPNCQIEYTPRINHRHLRNDEGYKYLVDNGLLTVVENMAILFSRSVSSALQTHD